MTTRAETDVPPIKKGDVIRRRWRFDTTQADLEYFMIAEFDAYLDPYEEGPDREWLIKIKDPISKLGTYNERSVDLYEVVNDPVEVSGVIGHIQQRIYSLRQEQDRLFEVFQHLLKGEENANQRSNDNNPDSQEDSSDPTQVHAGPGGGVW